jgi:hypothetical protein
VLEEDNDSGHGPPRSKGLNKDQRWKKEHGLESYFNCPGPPDFAPIENAWLPMKAYVRKYNHWSQSDTDELLSKGWDNMSQKRINGWIESMPERLRKVIDSGGRLVGGE